MKKFSIFLLLLASLPALAQLRTDTVNKRSITVVLQNKDTLIATLITVRNTFQYVTQETTVDTVRKPYKAPVTTPPPVITPPTSGSLVLLYANDFDAPGSINQNQLGRGSISTAIVKSGSGSFRSEVRGGDQAISNGYRSEQQYDEAYTAPQETVVTYDVLYESTTAGWGGSSIQWHPNNNNSGTVMLYTTEGNFNVTRTLNGTNTYQGGSTSYGTAITPGKWYSMRWEIGWATTTTGYVRLYIDGQLYYSISKAITMDKNGIPYLKVGQNRWGNVGAGAPTTVVYYDNLRVYKSP